MTKGMQASIRLISVSIKRRKDDPRCPHSDANGVSRDAAHANRASRLVTAAANHRRASFEASRRRPGPTDGRRDLGAFVNRRHPFAGNIKRRQHLQRPVPFSDIKQRCA